MPTPAPSSNASARAESTAVRVVCRLGAPRLDSAPRWLGEESPMLRRSLGFGFFVCVAFVVATACGGTVKQDTGSPSEQLRTGGPDRCKAACATAVACGLDSRSCDCACACPDGG